MIKKQESQNLKNLYFCYIENKEFFPSSLRYTLNSDSHKQQLYPKLRFQFQENLNIVEETKLLYRSSLVSKPLFFATLSAVVETKKSSSCTACPKRLDWHKNHGSLRLKVEFPDFKKKKKKLYPNPVLSPTVFRSWKEKISVTNETKKTISAWGHNSSAKFSREKKEVLK